MDPTIVDRIYHQVWDNSDGIAAQKILNEVQDKCMAEKVLEGVAKKNTYSLYATSSANSDGTQTDVLWNRYGATMPLPVLTLENVPRSCK